MGGAVAVTVRDWDGEIHRMTRWTNGLPYWFGAPHFFQGDREHLAKYLSQKGKVYDKAGDATLSPDGYGLVVVDCKNKKILSCQRYTDMRKISLTSIMFENSGMRMSDPDEDPRCLASNAAREWIRLGQVEFIDRYPDGKSKLLPIPENIEELLSLGDDDRDARRRLVGKEIVLRPEGWDIVEYEESLDGFRQMYKDVRELFEEDMTEEDHLDWIRFFEQLQEKYEEDEDY